MRALVTGGTGFIGSNIALHLMKQGHVVIITGTQDEQTLEEYKGEVVTGHLADIDWDSLGKFDIIFHQAANNDTTLLDEVEMNRANVEGTKKIFEFAKRIGCKRIVYASSTAIYGDVPAPYKEDGPVNPLNPYGVSKLLADEFTQEFMKENPDIIVVGLRYCNVYGPREDHKEKRASMIYQLAQQMLKGQPRIFKNGEQKRDFIYVKDVVEANMRAAEAQESCIVNCGLGKATTFNEVIRILNKVLGTTHEPEYIDNPYEDKYQNHTECDMSLAKEKTGFVPKYDIEEGIQDYYDSGFLTK